MSRSQRSKGRESRVEGDLYCSELYSPWQRGSNENGNGMVRRFFAKGTDFKFDHGVIFYSMLPYGYQPSVAMRLE